MRRLPWTHWTAILPVLIALSALPVGCRQVVTFEHEIQVQAADTGNPISAAKVRAEMGVRDFVETVSDAEGMAQFTFDEEHLGRWAKVIIEAEGYKRKSILVKLVKESPTSVVRLEPR